MLHHFNCPSESGNPNALPLVFDWDDETGEVTGPSAKEILADFKRGGVSVHPLPQWISISSTKSRADMAAVVGYLYQLPPELADFYPKYESEFDGKIRDLDGNVIGEVLF